MGRDLNLCRPMNLAVKVMMGWSLVVSNGKGPELVQASEPCCRSKNGGRDFCDPIERDSVVRVYSVCILNRK
jgi:hypothetical protein